MEELNSSFFGARVVLARLADNACATTTRRDDKYAWFGSLLLSQYLIQNSVEDASVAH